MTSSSSSAEGSLPQTPAPRPPPARPAVSQEETLLRAVEREIERSHAARRSSWASPVRWLVRKATKKGRSAASSRNLLPEPPSPSRTRQEGREAAKNGAGDVQGQGSCSVSKKQSAATAAAVDRPACAATMKRALERILAGDASNDDAEAFAEMEQAMKGLMGVLFKEKAEPVLPRAFMSNLARLDDNGWSHRDIITDPLILASGDESVDKFSHKWSSLGAAQPLLTAPNHLLREIITAWCLNHSIPHPSSTSIAFDGVPPSVEEMPLLIEKLSMHSVEQQEALHRIQLLSASSKGVQPCLDQWQGLLRKLIELHKKWKATWVSELEEQRLTIMLNLCLHRPNREILAKQVQLPDALKKSIERAKKLGYPLATVAKISSLIAILSEFDAFRSKLVEVGGISMLRRLLDTKDALVRNEASAAILALCTGDTASAITKPKHVYALLESLSDGVITDNCLLLLERTSHIEFVLDWIASNLELLMKVITQHGIGHVTLEGIKTAVCLIYNAVKYDAYSLKTRANFEDFVWALRNLETGEMPPDCVSQIDWILQLALELLPV